MKTLTILLTLLTVNVYAEVTKHVFCYKKTCTTDDTSGDGSPNFHLKSFETKMLYVECKGGTKPIKVTSISLKHGVATCLKIDNTPQTLTYSCTNWGITKVTVKVKKVKCSHDPQANNSTCNKRDTYYFTNHLGNSILLQQVSYDNKIVELPTIIKDNETGNVVVCKITNKVPAIIISDRSRLKTREVLYRFMFYPLLNTFTGEPYGQVAFSWSNDNKHIYLCRSHAYIKHFGDCNYV